MKIYLKIISCIALTVLFSACSTQKDISNPLLLQTAYKDRGININQLGQLEPDIVNELNVTDYYWKPHGKFDQNTLNEHFSIRYKGIILTIIEKDKALFVVTPDASIKANKKQFTALPLLNSELALSIQQDTQFIVNISQLNNDRSLRSLAQIITESNNSGNIQVLYQESQKQLLQPLLSANVALITGLPMQLKSTHFGLLSLCQSLNDNSVIGTYVTHQERLALLKNRDISFPELIKVLPHDANFNNLQQQLDLWRLGQYQKFDGEFAKISLEKPLYVPKETDLTTSERDKESIEKQAKLIMKISQ